MPGTTKKSKKRKTGTARAKGQPAKERVGVRKARVKAGARPGAIADEATPAATLRADLHLSREDFARLSGFSVRKLADLEKRAAMKASTAQRLTELRRLQEGLAIMNAEFVGEWLLTPNDAFDGLKPLEVIERGEVDRLWRMIYLVEAGIPV